MKLFISILMTLALYLLLPQAMAKTSVQQPSVLITTTQGEITVQLDLEHTPVTTQNFLNYVNTGFYDGTLFHRVIDGFMIQGGGFLPGMQQKPTLSPIKNEGQSCGKNTRGSVAMARTSDPHSATAQFFINVVDNPFLDFTAETMPGWGYCVFAHVVAGMEIVDKIKAMSTQDVAGYQNVPIENVVILHIKIIQPAVI